MICHGEKLHGIVCHSTKGVRETPSKMNKKRCDAPYGKEVSTKINKLITGAFDNEENADMKWVCQEIADKIGDALGFVSHDNHFMVAIVEIAKYDA